MTDDDLESILDLHAKWLRVEADGARANFAGANFAGAYLADANLAGVNFAGAYLAGANFAGANFARANFEGANLAGAYLAGVNFEGANLARANFAGAYLEGVNFEGANLARANLAGVRGNMAEVKSAQFDRWTTIWTCDPDGVTTLQIGCQRHALDMWIKSDPRWIAAMHSDAAEWWGKYRNVVLALVQASPATPWGKIGGGQ
jgi:uncharacterized protein YjbI with pentapeptide repeats